MISAGHRYGMIAASICKRTLLDGGLRPVANIEHGARHKAEGIGQRDLVAGRIVAKRGGVPQRVDGVLP